MTTKWAHLPNAAHIDRVLASFNSHPGQWNAAESEKWAEAWNAARDAVLAQGRYTEWAAAAEAAVWEVPRRDTILALVAYDDCAYMIDSDPGELAILAKFGDPRAVLLLSACKILHSIKESA